MTTTAHTYFHHFPICSDGVHTPITKTVISELKAQQKTDSWCLLTNNFAPNTAVYEFSDGNWSIVTVDRSTFTNTFEFSDRASYRIILDKSGNVLSKEERTNNYTIINTDISRKVSPVETTDNSNTHIKEYLANDSIYALFYENGRYIAGCRNFSYKQAIDHWYFISKSDSPTLSRKNRAKIFLEAIHKHQAKLPKEKYKCNRLNKLCSRIYEYFLTVSARLF